MDNNKITIEEISKFKKDWGQTDTEICECLGMELKDIDCTLYNTYLWDEHDQQWYNKRSSFFTKREQEIADYLVTNVGKRK